MNIHQKIQKLRKEENLSQRQLADKLGIGPSSVREYERGRTLSVQAIQQYMSHFDVSYEYLTNDNCNNRHPEDINIGKKLHLSDESISIISNLENTHTLSLKVESIDLRDRFDMFIKSVGLPELLLNIEIIQWLSELQYGIVLPLTKFASEEDTIIMHIENKNTDEISNILKKYESLLEGLKTFIEDFYSLTPFHSLDGLSTEITGYFSSIKTYINNGKILKENNIKYIDNVSEFQRCAYDIANIISHNIHVEEYQINKIIMQFTEDIQQEECKKWRDINGSTRNNKK